MWRSPDSGWTAGGRTVDAVWRVSATSIRWAGTRVARAAVVRALRTCVPFYTSRRATPGTGPGGNDTAQLLYPCARRTRNARSAPLTPCAGRTRNRRAAHPQRALRTRARRSPGRPPPLIVGSGTKWPELDSMAPKAPIRHAEWRYAAQSTLWWIDSKAKSLVGRPYSSSVASRLDITPPSAISREAGGGRFTHSTAQPSAARGAKALEGGNRDEARAPLRSDPVRSAISFAGPE
jgi:hypothetical protein